MDDSAKLRQQEEEAHDALARLRQVRDAIPDNHPSQGQLDMAIARALVYWHGLLTDRKRLEEAQRGGEEAKRRG